MNELLSKERDDAFKREEKKESWGDDEFAAGFYLDNGGKGDSMLSVKYRLNLGRNFEQFWA